MSNCNDTPKSWRPAVDARFISGCDKTGALNQDPDRRDRCIINAGVGPSAEPVIVGQADRGETTDPPASRASASVSDDDEFESFLTACRPTALAVACGVLHDRVLAEDAAQDAYVKVWKVWVRGGWGQVVNPRGYVLSAARSCAIDIWNRRHRGGGEGSLDAGRDDDGPGPVAMVPHAHDPASDLGDAAVRDSLWSAARDVLNDRELTVLFLYYRSDLNDREIGPMVDVPVNQVKMVRARALRKLRRAGIGDRFGPQAA